MAEPLMTIGAYAHAVGVPASALRHYDEVGLLVPDHVDPHTGYRFYSTETVRRAGVIRDLRDAGVPIETMRQVLDSDDGEGAATNGLPTDRLESWLEPGSRARGRGSSTRNGQD